MVVVGAYVSTFSGSITAYGACGADCFEAGGAGTIYSADNQEALPTITIANGGTSGAFTEFTDPQQFDANVIVRGNATIGPPQFGVPLNLTIAGDMVVEAGCSVFADGYGHPHCGGPGAAVCGTSVRLGGGGYGGAGGDGQFAEGGNPYGSPSEPTALGSGGAWGFGGRGGGTIHLVVNGVLQVDGTITVDGNPSQNHDSGAGSGGSIWLEVLSLVGQGTISAKGGDVPGSQQFSGGGGGGRVAVHNLLPNAFGGFAVDGGCGSCFESGWPGSLEQIIATDCNLNGLLDAWEIDTGRLPDLNNDRIPDACNADCDGSGSLDIGDFTVFSGCMTGPDGVLGPGCECSDTDFDTDSDLIDFAVFQALFGGN